MNVRAAHSAFYGGIYFRSRLESCWAMFFEAHSIPFEYEKRYCEFNDGTKYQPDFWLPESQTWFEVKGKLDEDDHHKILSLAREAGPRGESVLLGGSPVGYAFGDITDFGAWNLNSSFGRCAHCDRWTHAMFACRACGYVGTDAEHTTYIDQHSAFSRHGCNSTCMSHDGFASMVVAGNNWPSWPSWSARCSGIFTWDGNAPVEREFDGVSEAWSGATVEEFSKYFKIIYPDPGTGI